MSEVSRKGRSLKARALSFLAMREHTRAELHNKLIVHANGAEELANVLSELESIGLLSDARAACALVRSKGTRVSKSRMATTLRQKGVGDEWVALATAELDDLSTAQNVWQKKFGALPSDAKTLARQVRFLQSRGFALSVIMKVVRAQPFDDDA